VRDEDDLAYVGTGQVDSHMPRTPAATQRRHPPRAVIRRNRLQQQQLVRREPLALIEATTVPRTYASCKSVVSVFIFRNALECPTGGEVTI